MVQNPDEYYIPPIFNKKKVEEIRQEIEKQNGTKIRDFSTRDIVLILHKDTLNRVNEIDKKLDKHVEWGEKNMDMGNKFIREHDQIIQKITDSLEHIVTEMPERGFCEKVTNALWPQPPELPLDQKVDLIWHDRRWIKYLLAAAVTLGGGNILMQIFM